VNKVQTYLELVDNLQQGKSTKVDAETFSQPKPRISPVTIVDGKITDIVLSQSFIKSIFWTGDDTEYISSWDYLPHACAYQTYMVQILRKYKYPRSLAMVMGEYFESLAIGGGAYGKTTSLPRNTRTGKPLANEDRIKEAVIRFKKLAADAGIIVDTGTTQIEKTIPILDHGYDDIRVYVKVVADIISPFHFENLDYDLAVVDLKLTADRLSDFANPKQPWKNFCWGSPSLMTQLQGLLYSSVFCLPFLNNLIYYKAKHPGYTVVPIKTLESHPDDNEAKLRQREMLQGIKKTVATLHEWNEYEWPKNPGSHCQRCVVESCSAKKIINHV